VIGPSSPLRRHGLIEVGSGEGLTRSPLRIDERALHYLVGVDQPDDRLTGILERAEEPVELSPSHRAVADRLG
jgi:hypothetical protein